MSRKYGTTLAYSVSQDDVKRKYGTVFAGEAGQDSAKLDQSTMEAARKEAAKRLQNSNNTLSNTPAKNGKILIDESKMLTDKVVQTTFSPAAKQFLNAHKNDIVLTENPYIEAVQSIGKTKQTLYTEQAENNKQLKYYEGSAKKLNNEMLAAYDAKAEGGGARYEKLKGQLGDVQNKIQTLKGKNTALAKQISDANDALTYVKISNGNYGEIFERLYSLEYTSKMATVASAVSTVFTGGRAINGTQSAKMLGQYEDEKQKLNRQLLNAGFSQKEIDDTLASYKRYKNLVFAEQTQEEVQDWTKKSPVNAAIGTVGTVVSAPIRSLGSFLKILDGDANSPFDVLGNISKTVQGTTRNMIQSDVKRATGSEALAKAATYVYSGAVAGAESLVTMKTGGPLGELLMGLGAAGDAYSDSLNRGLTTGQALVNATAAGAFEAIFEHVSLEKLRVLQATPINPSASLKKQIITGIKNTALQFVTEGSEEVATDLANELFDYLYNGGASKYLTYVREQKEKGVSEADAKKAYAIDLTKQIGESFIVGGISGGLSAGAVQTANVMQNSAENRSVGKAVQNYAKTTEDGMPGLVTSMRGQIDAGTTADKRLSKINENSGARKTGAAVRNFLEEATKETIRDTAAIASLKADLNTLSNSAADAAADLTPVLRRIGLNAAEAQTVSTALKKLAVGEMLTSREEDLLVEQDGVIAKRFMETLAFEQENIQSRTALVQNLVKGIESVENKSLKTKLRTVRDKLQGKTEAQSKTGTAEDTQTEKKSPLANEPVDEPAARQAEDPVYREVEQRAAKANRQGASENAVRVFYNATDANGDKVRVYGVKSAENGRLQVEIDKESGASADIDTLRFSGPEADEAQVVFETLSKMMTGDYTQEGVTLSNDRKSYNPALSKDSANAALAYLAETADVDAVDFLEEWYDLYALGKTGHSQNFSDRARGGEGVLPYDVVQAAYRSGRDERSYDPGVTRIGTSTISDSLVYQLQVLDSFAKKNNISILATDQLQTPTGKRLLGQTSTRGLVVSLFRNAKDETGGRVERENVLTLAAYHEAAHRLRIMDESSYQTIRDMVLTSLREDLSAEDYQALYEQRTEAYGNDPDAVEEEIVAQFLGTGKAVLENERVAAAVSQNPTVWQKFADVLKKVVAEIREAIKALSKTDRTVAAALQTEEKKLQGIVNAFDTLLAKATAEQTAKTEAAQKESPAGEGGEKYSFALSKNGLANDNLLDYSDELKGIIEKNGDVILDSFNKLKKFVHVNATERKSCCGSAIKIRRLHIRLPPMRWC